MVQPSFGKAGALANYFQFAPHRFVMKWSNYFEIYEELFCRFRANSDLRFLEIGIAKGGSLQMWRNYFGIEAVLVGIDVQPECKRFECNNTYVRIGDQADPVFLQEVVDELGPFNIVLDDGGHHMHQQIASFENLYPTLKNNGLYLVEDVHTSYWKEFGGGVDKHGTFIEYMKRKIDEVNGFHSLVSREELLTQFTRSCYSVTFYDSMIAVQKREMRQPQFLQLGDLND